MPVNRTKWNYFSNLKTSLSSKFLLKRISAAKYPRKPHENEKIMVLRGRGRRPLLNPPMSMAVKNIVYVFQGSELIVNYDEHVLTNTFKFGVIYQRFAQVTLNTAKSLIILCSFSCVVLFPDVPFPFAFSYVSSLSLENRVKTCNSASLFPKIAVFLISVHLRRDACQVIDGNLWRILLICK